jgi:hypothetical protein
MICSRSNLDLQIKKGRGYNRDIRQLQELDVGFKTLTYFHHCGALCKWMCCNGCYLLAACCRPFKGSSRIYSMNDRRDAGASWKEQQKDDFLATFAHDDYLARNASITWAHEA